MFSRKRMLYLGSITILLLSGLLFVAHAKLASAATVSCGGASFYFNDANEEIELPTISNTNHNDDCELGVGNQGTAVYWLQFDLNQCYDQTLQLDGKYGSETQEAVEDAQAEAGVTPQDGIYGPVTRDHIKWVNYGGAGESACFQL